MSTDKKRSTTIRDSLVFANGEQAAPTGLVLQGWNNIDDKAMDGMRIEFKLADLHADLIPVAVLEGVKAIGKSKANLGATASMAQKFAAMRPWFAGLRDGDWEQKSGRAGSNVSLLVKVLCRMHAGMEEAKARELVEQWTSAQREKFLLVPAVAKVAADLQKEKVKDVSVDDLLKQVAELAKSVPTLKAAS